MDINMFLNKKLIKMFSVIFMFFSFSAFALDDAVNTGRFNNTAIDGYDTVAYFTQSKAVEGDKKHQVEWRGANWFFSSEENKALFIVEPEKYAPQYGGWCAYAMADGSTARIDPEAFQIHEGKLYLNYNKKVQGFWLEDKIENIKKANDFYPVETNVNSFTKK